MFIFTLKTVSLSRSVDVINIHFSVGIRMSIYPWCTTTFFSSSSSPFYSIDLFRQVCDRRIYSEVFLLWRSFSFFFSIDSFIVIHLELLLIDENRNADLKKRMIRRRRREKREKDKRKIWTMRIFPKWINRCLLCVSRLIKRKVKTDCNGKQKAERNLRLRPEEYTSIDCVSDWRAFSLVYWSNCKIKLNRLFFFLFL
jgi:hypothetical protein